MVTVPAKTQKFIGTAAHRYFYAGMKVEIEALLNVQKDSWL
jgi:hypothetical protein